MKAFTHYLALLICLLSTAACLSEPQESPNNAPDAPTINNDKKNNTRTAILLEGALGTKATDIVEFGFEMSETNFEGGETHIQRVTELESDNTFSFLWTDDLEPSRTYSFRSYIANGKSRKYSRILPIQTESKSAARISDITREGDLLVVRIEDDGGLDILDVGFFWSESSDIQEIKQKMENRVKGERHADGTFSIDLSTITAFVLGKTYYFLAYVVNSDTSIQYTGYSGNCQEVIVTESFPATIEDKAWSDYLVSKFDTNRDGRMSYGELKAILDIDVITDNIASLKGLELMPELKRLVCRGSAAGKGKLEELDLSRNPNLVTLVCDNNRLKALDLLQAPLLDSISCAGNQLAALSVSAQPGLKYLNVSGNQSISSLDVSQNSELLELSCGNNMIAAINVSENLKLETLEVKNNQLSALNISENALLRRLDCSGNNITELDISTNRSLRYLDCRNNPLKALYLFANQSVETMLIPAGMRPSYQITSITVEPETLTIQVDESATLKAVIDPEDAIDQTLEWKSSNERVATVDRDGKVTGVTIDTCTIAVTCCGKTAYCKVTVKPVPVSEVTLDMTEKDLLVGESFTLHATVHPANATEKTVTWSTDNEAVASVTKDGRVTARSIGTCNVKAVCGGKEATCRVNVTSVPITSITIEPDECTLEVGQTLRLSTTILPEETTESLSWDSDDEAVATVSEYGEVTAVGPGTCSISAFAGNVSAYCAVTVIVPVTGVSLDITSYELEMGETVSLTATVSPANATDKSVSWSSNRPSVATVSGGGVVKAVSPGSCTITAKAGNCTAACQITVKGIPVESVSLSQTSWSTTVGSTLTLEATVSPDNATDKTVSWKSNNTSVATVSDKGLVTAVAAGSCTITATAGGKSATCSVTVTSGGGGTTVNSITVNPTSYTLPVGGNTTITATVDPSDAAITWSSSNESVAMVSQSGYVFAISEGECDIIAKAGDKSATCKLKVIIPVTGVTLDRTDASIIVGGTTTLTATVEPSNATDKTVTWTSSEPSVATVSDKGVVTGVGTGNANISVTAGDYSATCKVTVSSSDGYVPINSNIFPDDAFRPYIKSNYDYDNDGLLSNTEIQSVTTLSLDGMSIRSLIGVEHFFNLTYLYCRNNKISELDLSHNTELSRLDCSSNTLTHLDITNNTKLVNLSCYGNYLSDLDLTNNSILENVTCSNNKIKRLDFSNCYKIVYIECYENEISEIVFSFNPYLEKLYCGRNKITSIILPSSNAFTWLDCAGNEIYNLDISSCPNLKDLVCDGNLLNQLSLTNNANLESIACGANKLTSLDLSSQTALEHLWCAGNRLTSLDVSCSLQLNDLSCQNNQLTSLDLSKNTALTELYCYDNQLTSLDVSKSTALRHLWCYDNQIEDLNISNNPNLIFLTCGNNKLTVIDVSHCPMLEGLHFSDNRVSSIIAITCSRLVGLSCENNELTELNLSYYPGLMDLRCEGNKLKSIDLSTNNRLDIFLCDSNQFTSLDLSNNLNLSWVSCRSNPYLTEIWLKTGQVIPSFYYDSIATIKYKE